MRETTGPGILDVACFPLVPFSNRIADGRFVWQGNGQDKAIALPPNAPAVDARHPLHGYGWLAAWDVADAGADRLRLVHAHEDDVWPWPYRAELDFTLDAEGLTVRLSLTNLGAEAMPAGLGFHPYFPRTETTRYCGLHRGEWHGGDDPLPVTLDQRTAAIDWWDGKPVWTRPVDTIYAGREGLLEITWPERRLAATIAPTANLPFTTVYVPHDADWFCVEPVSHLTDAVNRRDPDAPMPLLEPGETAATEMRISARRF